MAETAKDISDEDDEGSQARVNNEDKIQHIFTIT